MIKVYLVNEIIGGGEAKIVRKIFFDKKLAKEQAKIWKEKTGTTLELFLVEEWVVSDKVETEYTVAPELWKV